MKLSKTVQLTIYKEITVEVEEYIIDRHCEYAGGGEWDDGYEVSYDNDDINSRILDEALSQIPKDWEVDEKEVLDDTEQIYW